jgi:hypothetical protein
MTSLSKLKENYEAGVSVEAAGLSGAIATLLAMTMYSLFESEASGIGSGVIWTKPAVLNN